MKKLCICLLAASLMVFGGGLPSAYAGQGGATINGDVNCSGDLDLSDAVYTLSFLFLGGESPCPLAEQPGDGARVEELEEEVATQAAEIAALRAELFQVRGDLVDIQTDLIESQRTSLDALQQVSVLEEELEGARRDLAVANETADLCQGELGKVNPRLAECVAQLAATQIDLNECQGDLLEFAQSYTNCVTDLAASEAAQDVAEARLGELEVPGCTDPEADNYDCSATIDDGSCEIPGCTNPDSPNFSPRATVDDGSCDQELEIEGFSFSGRNTQGYAEYSHSDTGIVFVMIPGTGPNGFQMGSPGAECDRDVDEGPVHEVVLSPFLIAKYEVTQSQWIAVTGENPSYCRFGDRSIGRFPVQCRVQGDPASDSCPWIQSEPETHPVEYVTWFECQVFCEGIGLELPSEAQWEYSCRAGTTTPFSFGSTITRGDANFNVRFPYCSDPRPEPIRCSNWGADDREREVAHGVHHEVDAGRPNNFGLYNMHGNIAEWCLDTYDGDFYSQPEASGQDPINTSEGSLRVIRGGGYMFGARTLRSAYRESYSFRSGHRNIGFRPAFNIDR